VGSCKRLIDDHQKSTLERILSSNIFAGAGTEKGVLQRVFDKFLIHYNPFKLGLKGLNKSKMQLNALKL
jgi:hypothetical protein